MEESENVGKKTIVITEEDIGKKPIIVTEKNENNSQDIKRNVKNEKLKWIFIIVFICVIMVTAYFFFGSTSIETAKDSVVMIKVYDENNNEISTGSGFCAYKSNYIVTNFHVIEGASTIKIVTDEVKTYKIEDVLIFNPTDDLAIISGNFTLKPLKIGNVNNLRAGQEITTIGSPKAQLNTVSTGVISNADNDYEIRITAPISPGSSGGVLIDKWGKVIGITYAIYNSEDSQNINYAISVKYLEDTYDALVNESYINVNRNNYDSFLPEITNATSYIFEDYFGAPDLLSFKSKTYNKYYSTNTIYEFYESTNKRKLFDRAMELMGEYSLKDIYNKMTNQQKDRVIENYEYLQCFDSYNVELSSNIQSWNMEQFILELKLMQAHELAIITEELNNINNQDDFVKLLEEINNSYEDKIIIHRLIYSNDNRYNNDIVNTINENEKLDYEQRVEILKYLGMTVYNDGTVKW